MARKLDVEVLWGDITLAKGDVHAVGHYIGVAPQQAELALDRAISEERLLITQLTARGALRGALGEVIFFPWSENRVVALAGMGQPGRFHQAQLQYLARSLATTVGLLPGRNSLTTVLIGSGTGNLSVQASVDGFLTGIVDALDRSPAVALSKVSIIELLLDRALEIATALDVAAKSINESHRVRVRPVRRVVESPGGRIPDDFGCSMLLAKLASATGARSTSKARAALNTVLEGLPQDAALRKDVLERLRKPLRKRGQAPKRSQSWFRKLAMEFRLHRSEVGAGAQPIPTRVAFWNVQDTIHAAAITGTTTVTERAIYRRLPHVERTVERLRNPDPKRTAQLGEELRQVLVPSELREVFATLDPLIIEVDRSLSQVQWEMLSPGESDGRPLAALRPVARQLRTQYSPRPFAITERTQLRALVIGDPGDPQRQQSLSDAQTEALEVSALLRKHGIDTTALIGAPEDGTGAGPIEGIQPADFFEVVRRLRSGDFDLVHYTGHALFNPSAAARSGWLFKDGVLTADELNDMERPPRLVFANACVSLQLAQAAPPTPAEAANARHRGDAQLVAGLADEFFRRGVSDYIGTAWEVPSKPAVQFATLFYTGILRGAGGKRAPFTYGEALRAARAYLYSKSRSYGTTWGAYQHYGDPTRLLAVRNRF